jgi:hypothetical protein
VEEQKMATARIRRSARRGVAAAALGWLGVAAVSVLMAPGASAATSYTVHIKDLTPPVASVDKGGTVTFINEIPDKKVQVGGLLSLVSVTAKTTATLTLPSGKYVLPPTPDPVHPDPKSVHAEAFTSTCVTCTITYTYQLSSGSSLTAALTSAALGKLPALPVPTPFVVNTLVSLPNLPGINLPSLPPVTIPNVPGGVLPAPPGGTPGTPTPGVPGQPKPPAAPPVQGIPGDTYAYNTGSGSPQLSPGDTVAASAFDSSRYFGTSQGVGGGNDGSAGSAGSGARPGSYDGASVPVFGQLAGLDGTKLKENGAQKVASGGAAQTLPVAALAAVVMLAGVTAALVRTHQASRATR